LCFHPHLSYISGIAAPKKGVHNGGILCCIMITEERKKYNLEGLKDYLPSEDEGYNRDMGVYDKIAHTFRFGAKHNDIYPIIGDMIRWKAELPKRSRTGIYNLKAGDIYRLATYEYLCKWLSIFVQIGINS